MSPAEVCTLAQNLAKNCRYSVFPVRLDKRPATPKGTADAPGGLYYASNDLARVAELWRRWPGPLVGIRTGETSGVDVLDIDAEGLAWWQAARPHIPPTRTYATRSGGLHVYFQHVRGVRNTAGKLAKNVDTRGCGGYIVYWFSAGLECLDHSPVAPWPGKLLELVLCVATHNNKRPDAQ